jgi:tRNA(Ile)-lysidine synthase
MNAVIILKKTTHIDLETAFLEKVRAHNLLPPERKLLLAVSGGIDSVVLCELCHCTGFSFQIAHCNFQLRGEESERDEKFVVALGEKYKAEVHIRRFDTNEYAAQNKISVQEAARDLRYTFFDEIIQAQGGNNNSPSLLLTAHHADDNAETVLMNFCRGTGLKGLTGIPLSAGYIRRPLLFFSRDQLLHYATEKKLEYVDDSSNLSEKYTRNYFRHTILPALAKAYPAVKTNLLDNIRRFTSIAQLYELSVGHIRNKLCRTKGNEIHIPIKQLLSYNNSALVYEIISPFGFSEKQVSELYKLANSGSGKFILSADGRYRIIHHRHWFIITPIQDHTIETYLIEEDAKDIIAGPRKFVFQKIAGNQLPKTTSGELVCFDIKQLEYPLLLRKWKQGDYFYPLGMKKKKKLARFFIDRKLSTSEKEKIWVLESGQRIIWVVGLRMDERFKVTDATNNMLCITSTPS